MRPIDGYVAFICTVTFLVVGAMAGAASVAYYRLNAAVSSIEARVDSVDTFMRGGVLDGLRRPLRNNGELGELAE